MNRLFTISVSLALISFVALAQQGPTTLPRSSQPLQLTSKDDRKIGGIPIDRYVREYANAARNLDIPPGTSDAQIGRGYDSATNEIKEQCIVFKGADAELATVIPTGSHINPDGQQVDFNMTHTTDSEELLNTLSIEASASFSSGVYSGNASVKYATSKKVTRFGEYLLINEQVQNVTRFLKTIDTTPEAKKVRKNPFNFRQKCGDQFIVGIVTGGSFSAILNASSSSENDQSSVKATFSAAAYGGKLDASTMSTFQDLVGHGRLEITILRQGPNDNVPNDLDSIKKYAAELPSKVKPTGGTPWPILMTTKGYGSLGPVIIGAQDAYLDAAGVQYMRLKRLSGGLEYISAHQDLFGGFDQNKYQAEHDAAEQAARALFVSAETCGKDSTKCPTAPFKTPRELPERIQWVAVDPKTNGWTPVGSTQGSQHRIAQAVGQFSYYGGPQYVPAGQSEWVPASQGQIWMHNSNTGQDQIVGASQIYAVPDFNAVYYRVWDSIYTDNRSRPDDPLRAAVYTPVYPVLKTGGINTGQRGKTNANQ
jgi:hypothetical protein